MKVLATVGSYDKSIYGVEYKVSNGIVSEQAVSFALPAHTGCIKCISSCSRYLATGSTDETIRVFDLLKRKDIGTLTSHSGTVTALAFVGEDILASGAEDGNICLFRCRDWEEVRRIKAHKHGVVALAVHPSGKLMLSVGNDGKIRMWDMRTGKLAHAKKCPFKNVFGIAFSPSGSLFACQSPKEVKVFKGDECIMTYSGESVKNLSCMTFADEASLLIGGEGSMIIALSDRGSIELSTQLKPRVKCMSRVDSNLVLACSSDGTLALLKCNGDKVEELSSSNCKLRITCCAVINKD